MSENSIIQMYGTADTDSSAVIDVPDDGVLLSTSIEVYTAGYAADLDAILGEISFASVSQFGSNDARGVLARIVVSADLIGVAANTMRTDARTGISYGDGLKVFGGERIYMHILDVGSGVVVRMYALLLFNFKNFVQRRR